MRNDDTDHPPFFEDDEDTGQRNIWRMAMVVRLQRVEEVVTALKTLRWLISLVLVIGISLAAWSVRTTLVNEVRLESVERSVYSFDALSRDITGLKTEINYLRRDLERMRTE